MRKPVVFANSVATRLHNIFMLIGYARVSKVDQQDTRAQVKALKEAGCKRIFEESASGVGGIDLNCTVRWTSSGRAISSSYGNWTVCRGH